jgi:phosphoglycerate kinase
MVFRIPHNEREPDLVPDFLTLDDIQLHGKTVLLRADLNIPPKNGEERLKRILPTLRDLAKANAKIVILSHFGRPGGGLGGKPDPAFSLAPVVTQLQALWGKPIQFAADCIGPVAVAAVKALPQGEILVLENTRFHAGEEANDPAFAQQLAALGDVYINDAFSAAHRAHASTEGLARLLPAAAGRALQAELVALDKALGHPERPLAAIIGGSKISTKLDLLENIVGKVDMLVLGGGMANTFLAAKGINIGKSLHEPDMLATAKGIMARAEAKGCQILLPKDAVVAPALQPGVAVKTVPVTAVPADQMILDLGPASIKEVKEGIEMCKTVVWNGPLGAFEIPPFDHATVEVAIAVADLTKRAKLLSVAGGGDTVAAMAHAGVTVGLSYLSTAGGAFLEWLEGKELPGITALRQAVPVAKQGKIII